MRSSKRAPKFQGQFVILNERTGNKAVYHSLEEVQQDWQRVNFEWLVHTGNTRLFSCGDWFILEG